MVTEKKIKIKQENKRRKVQEQRLYPEDGGSRFL
jgi:hypothetical protein